MENRRKKPLFPPGEQPQIIFTAYRSIEDSFYSFEETKKWIWSLKYEDESVEHCVCKWILGKETPKDVLECKLRMVGGQLCTIDVYMDDYRGMVQGRGIVPAVQYKLVWRLYNRKRLFLHFLNMASQYSYGTPELASFGRVGSF
jgi:hypothetical protein